MSDEWAQYEAAEVLRALGSVRMPAPRVLEGAREALWSAIATEMLGSTSDQVKRGRQVTERDNLARRRQE